MCRLLPLAACVLTLVLTAPAVAESRTYVLCANAKAAKVMVMTVALDLSTSNSTENKAIEALKACASDSRFRKDPATGKAAKLFWNATGATLSDDFKSIANELSNLRIIS